jgi:tyrosine-protein kinase Etk/Wzc
MIAAIVVTTTVLSAAATFLIPKTYKADVTIFPMGGQKGGSLAMMASQAGLGGLLGAVGGGAANPSVQVMAILKSRTLAEKVIQKCDLMKVFFKDSWDEVSGQWREKNPLKQPHMEDAVKALFDHVTFNDDKKTQTIVIKSVFRDPELAATVANVYTKELSDYLKRNTFTIAKKNRIFIEHQVERNRADLLDIGKKISAFYSLNKISNVVPMVDVDVSPADEPSPMESTDMEALRKKTEELQDKVEAMRSQISETQGTSMVRDVPQQVYLQYLSLQRELLGQINTLLTQQYEMSKVEEAKEDINFQVIDWAEVPFRRYRPERKKIVIGAFAFSLLVSVTAAFLKEYLEQNRSRA